MVDLTDEMADLWASLGPGQPGRGRVLQFASAATGEGTSTVAREFAFYAALRARRPVWLVETDLDTQTQFEAVAREAERYGPLGTHAAASPDGSAFFAVQLPGGSGKPGADSKLLIARPLLNGRLWLTRFRREAVAQQQVQILPLPAYWEALRRHAEWVVVDSPAYDRSITSVTLAPVMDATVLVVSSQVDVSGPAALRSAIAATGGRCAGLVFNRAPKPAPALLRRLLP
jgi:hypothetical protein